ncbi:hypothetical protein [Taklimakanibacter deserti]|uniref:hypothetical protein n=1 Tax=Taklimakanibacter deserti TaxID=2267839 RepID=UPI000E65576B
MRHLSVVFLVLLGLTTTAVAASSNFECPAQPGDYLKLGPAEMAALLPVGDPLDDPAKLDAAIDTLRRQGLSSALIIDGLIGSYCPIVAADTSLTVPQKTSRVQKFAMRITRLVYSFEGAEAIILDVPFDPPVVDAIRSKAAAAGVTPEKWIAEAVDTVLNSK